MNQLNVKLELKSLSKGQFEGYGSTFGNVDLGEDVVLPGAFTESLVSHQKAGTMPMMFWYHQPDMVPGKWLDMSEDMKGLYVKGQLADTQLGNEMHTLLGMKAVRGLSIGFQIKDRQKDQAFDENGVRLLKKIDLWEVSIVSFAMNPLAKVEGTKAVRLSRDGEYVPTEREFERRLREVGCSKSVARLIVSRIFDNDDQDPGGTPGAPRWDAGDVDETEEVQKYLRDFLEKSVVSTLRDRFKTVNS